MKQRLSNIVFATCAVFLIMGLITIVKGDIENAREGIFMVIYLTLFLSIIIVVKWKAFCRLR